MMLHKVQNVLQRTLDGWLGKNGFAFLIVCLALLAKCCSAKEQSIYARQNQPGICATCCREQHSRSAPVHKECKIVKSTQIRAARNHVRQSAVRRISKPAVVVPPKEESPFAQPVVMQERCFLMTELSFNSTTVGPNFSGNTVTVFANKTCPRGREIFIVRGPGRTVSYRQAGSVSIKGQTTKPIWATLYNVPSLYILSASQKIESMVGIVRAREFSIGLRNTAHKFAASSNSGRAASIADVEWARQQAVEQGRATGLFAECEEGTEISGSRLFTKARIFLPARIAPSVYTFETILTINGNIASISIDPFQVLQSPISGIIREVSAKHKLSYYCVVICTAIGMGLISFSILEAIGSTKLRRKRG